MKKIASVLGIAGLLVAGTASAAWSNAVTLSSIEIDGGEFGTTNQPYPFLTFTTTPTGKPACGGTLPVFLQGSPDQVKQQTSALTAAFLAGRPVKVWWDSTGTGCSTISGSQYARVIHVMIQ